MNMGFPVGGLAARHLAQRITILASKSANIAAMQQFNRKTLKEWNYFGDPNIRNNWGSRLILCSWLMES